LRAPGRGKCLADDLDALVVHLRYPTRHRRRWRSTNLLERSLGEVKRGTKVMGRFPGEDSCLTLVWAVLDLLITHKTNGIRFTQLDRQLRCAHRTYRGSGRVSVRADELAVVRRSKSVETQSTTRRRSQGRDTTTMVGTALDGFIAGAGDNADLAAADPVTRHGLGGDRLFSWLTVGDTPSRVNPNFKMAARSAAFFDEGVGATGAVVAGRRTYDVSGAWGGRAPCPRTAPLRRDPPRPGRGA
jgi:hypothetical protein